MSRWRQVFWPIMRSDLPKFLPIFLMGFLICFNYSLLRCLKDTVVITSSSSGAAVIPFLKMWGVLPAAILATITMSYLFRKFSRDRVFYLSVGGFVGYFLIFGTIIYPLREALELNGLANFLSARLPAGFAAPIAVLRHWPLSLFYVVCELWKIVVLMVVFWGFVNANSKLAEAKRFYAPLMVSGSIALFVAGKFSQFVGLYAKGSTYSWDLIFGCLCGTVVVAGLGILFIYWRLRGDKREGEPETSPEVPLSKKMRDPRSLLESLRLVFKSPLLVCIALTVVAEYIAFNLVEVLWKQQVYLMYPDPESFYAYTGKIVSYTGILGVIGSLFVANNIIRKSGWTTIAILSPIVLLVTSLGFFGFLLMDIDATFLGYSAAALAVSVGAIHNCICRASRQAFLDPAKEIAYVHLPGPLQTQGKTFVDGMSPTVGKSSAALIQQGLIVASPTVLGIAPYSAVIVVLSLAIAFVATTRAGNRLREAKAELIPANT